MTNKPDLNITPFVDVMLVLLAILMISSTTITYKEELVTLPSGTKHSSAKKNAQIEIVIKKNGDIIVDKKPYDSVNFLESFNLNYGNYDKNALIYISCDQEVSYKTFMNIYSSIIKSGFVQVGLLTR